MRFLLSLLIITFSTPALASDIGVKIGSGLPHPLTLKTQDGVETSFDNLKGEKGLVLFFVRSLDWCPYCKTQVIELKDRAAEVTDLGYNIAILSYDSVETLATFSEKQSISFPLLSDPASDVIRAFDILNEDMAMGTTFYGIPHPVVYVIAADKTIQNKVYKDGYKQRPSIDEILKVLQ